MEKNQTKAFYITLKGQRIQVTEEVYREYVRPVRNEQRAARRNWKCILHKEKYGIVRCKEDCSKCKYAQAGGKALGNNLSLDEFIELGLEPTSLLDMEGDVIAEEELQALKERIAKAVSKLNERQQYIIREIYFHGKTQTELCDILGIDKSSMSKALSRALESLKRFLENL